MTRGGLNVGFRPLPQTTRVCRGGADGRTARPVPRSSVADAPSAPTSARSGPRRRSRPHPPTVPPSPGFVAPARLHSPCPGEPARTPADTPGSRCWSGSDEVRPRGLPRGVVAVERSRAAAATSAGDVPCRAPGGPAQGGRASAPEYRPRPRSGPGGPAQRGNGAPPQGRPRPLLSLCALAVA